MSELMLFKRKVEYNPTLQERKFNLTFQYSRRNDKVIMQYDYRFIRVCDYPYSEMNWLEVQEHLLLLPIWNSIEERQRAELWALIEVFSLKWYTVVRNAIRNQSVPSIIHLHLLRF